MRPTSRYEAAWLLTILAAALLARVLWCDGDVPRTYFAQTTTLTIADLADRGELWRHWQRSLGWTQVNWVDESAVMVPVALAFHAILGPSLHLPAEIGAFWGVLAVLLAWGLGRSVRSPVFGLIFAALVAASPLQITWSRLGGVYIGAPAHVLLVLLLGVLAGKRRSFLLAALAGALAWASIYHYYAARVAIPLAFVGLLAGFRLSQPTLRRALLLVAASSATLVAFGAVALTVNLGPRGIWGGLWPQYPGYVGSRGPQAPLDIVTDAVTVVRAELPKAARAYFWADRTGSTGPAARRSVSVLDRYGAVGGLCLLPVGVLGAIGALVALVRWRRDAIWLALAVLGILVPCLSVTTARRFLVFDLAWSAFAAGGVIALLRLGSLPSRRAGAAVAGLVGLSAYSTALILALGARLPPEQFAGIPFAESGFGDGLTCLACARHARRWEDMIRAGAFVVVFDTDVVGEGGASPGGLQLYGKIAALTAGKPRRFADYYTLVANLDFDPPRVGEVYDAARADFASYLADAIAREQPTEIRWEFVQPTLWERWLADRLVAAGGTRVTMDDPSLVTMSLRHPDPGFEIVTPWERRADALAVLSELASGPATAAGCVRVASVGREQYPVPAVVLAQRRARAPRWTVGGYGEVYHDGQAAGIPDAIALAVDVDAEGRERVEVVTRWAKDVTYDPAGTARTSTDLPFLPPLGPGCAVRLGSEWWVLDPIAGVVERTSREAWRPPPGRWVGIAGDGAGHLLLAAADQTIHVFDTTAGGEVVGFSGWVSPSRRTHFGECTPLVAGDGWIATLDHFHRRLSVYSDDGRPLGDVVLDMVAPMRAPQPSTIAAAGNLLGVASRDGTVVTLRLDVDPTCSASRAAAREP